MKKGFTLAEILIVLTVVALIAVILLPSVKNAMPNENLIKFKKAHEALHKTIGELANTDKYYLEGDLGVKINGDSIDGSHEKDRIYLCETFADSIQTKKVNCVEYGETNSQTIFGGEKHVADVWCKTAQRANCDRIYRIPCVVSKDNIYFFEVNNSLPFGYEYEEGIKTYNRTLFRNELKAICFDVDGWCKGEDPFGYGLRFDGKIFSGNRADEWLSKSIQDTD